MSSVLHFQLQRGAVLVESALVTSATMLIALGAISVTAIGYSRVSSDGAAFIAARTYAQTIAAADGFGIETTTAKKQSGVTSQRVVDALVPGMRPVVIQEVAIPNKGIGQPNASFNQNARTGGSSITVPQGRQATVTAQTNGIFGSTAAISVSGIGMEADPMVVEPAFNIAGDNKYQGKFDRTNPYGGAIKYFGTSLDLPPFYFSHNLTLFCGSAVSFQTCDNTTPYLPSLLFFYAFGVAEHLDPTNWSRPTASTTYQGGSPNVFAEMLCHQRVFAYIAKNFLKPSVMVGNNETGRHQYPSYHNTDPIPDQTNSLNAIAADPFTVYPVNYPGPPYYTDPYMPVYRFGTNQWKTRPLNLVYSWDVYMNYGQQNNSNKVGDRPVYPLNGCDLVDQAY